MAQEMHRYEHSVINTCAALRGALSGSGDPMSNEEIAERLAWLRWRSAEGWDNQSLVGWEAFDAGVRMLAIATVASVERVLFNRAMSGWVDPCAPRSKA